MLMRIAATAVVTMFAVTAAYAGASNGEHLAQRWCAPCHAVVRGETKAKASTPALATIARSPEFSRERLATSLLLFHPKMPDMSLTRDEASDLADYIAKLGHRE
jgi:mono/diheme cytochrome c family protein